MVYVETQNHATLSAGLGAAYFALRSGCVVPNAVRECGRTARHRRDY